MGASISRKLTTFHNVSHNVSHKIQHQITGIPNAISHSVELKGLDNVRIHHGKLFPNKVTIIFAPPPPSVQRLLTSLSLLLTACTWLVAALTAYVLQLTLNVSPMYVEQSGRATGFETFVKGFWNTNHLITALATLYIVYFAFGKKITRRLKIRAIQSSLNSLDPCIRSKDQLIVSVANTWREALQYEEILIQSQISLLPVAICQCLHDVGLHLFAKQLAEETVQKFLDVFGLNSGEYWRMRTVLARARAELDDTHRAKEDLAEILAVSGGARPWLDVGTHQLAQLLLSCLHFKEKKFQESLDICQQVLDSLPDHDDENELVFMVRRNKAAILYEQGNLTDAVNLLRELPPISLSKPNILYFLNWKWLAEAAARDRYKFDKFYDQVKDKFLK